MKTRHNLIVCSLLVCGACYSDSDQLSQVDEQAVIAEVEEAFNSLAVAAKSLKAEPYFDHFSPDQFTALVEGAVLLSFEEFEQMYREQLPLIEGYLTLEFNKVKITPLSRNAAVLVNEFSETIALATGDTLSIRGGGTQVWTRMEGVWKLVHVSGSTQPVD